LLFSQPVPEELPEIIANRLCSFVSDLAFADMSASAAASAGIRIAVYLKIDTGMGRIGCSPPEAAANSAAPEDIAYTRRQLALFHESLARIQAAGLAPGIVHAANSGGVLLHPDSWFDMVRPGILLYGYNALHETNADKSAADLSDVPHAPLRIAPVMELCTQAED
jgi:alanine racemase